MENTIIKENNNRGRYLQIQHEQSNNNTKIIEDGACSGQRSHTRELYKTIENQEE